MNVVDRTVLARGAALNLLGQGTPLVVAFLCLPFVAKGLGSEKFGLLALCWTIVGSATAFDLGFSRATVKMISGALAGKAEHDIARILGSTLVAQVVLGTIVGLVIFIAAPMLSANVFAFPADLRSDGTAVLRLIACVMPFVLVSSALRGVLSASQQFAAGNTMAVLSNSSIYILSAVGASAGWKLPTIVAMLVASRALMVPVIWRTVRVHGPRLEQKLAFDAATLRALIQFGSWVTVSNAVLPVLTRAERFLIPPLLSLGALAYYIVPYEAVSRLAIVPNSISSTLFPAFSRVGGQHKDLTDLVSRPIRYLMVVMTIVLCATALFADHLLTAWMGSAFSVQARTPLRILAAACYFAAFTPILRAALQGLGRPDLRAKLDLANAALFLGLLFWTIPAFGLAGAAGAKLVVTFVELSGSLVLLTLIAPDALNPLRLWRSLSRDIVAAAVFVVVSTATVVLMGDAVAACAAFLVSSVIYVLVFWTALADPKDRDTLFSLQDWLRRKGTQPL